ncbi:MAG: hypothetical protein FWF56_03765 [Firmicutes bacterium]|nr:hypothetical protein [Bacillota bacterium]MCL1954045.1 hypothetical protein [Bacillota bacterium]
MFFNNNNSCCGGGSNDMFLILLLLCGFGGNNNHGCGNSGKSIDMCDLVMFLLIMSCFGGRDCK